MNTPKLSVVMSVYNETLSELNDSISSVLNQTYHNFEFIIIDDNPKSNRIKEYLINKSKIDDRIRLIFNLKNINQCNSRNKAIRYAIGEYIAIIDADDIIIKNRLELQLKFLINNKLDLSFTNFSIIDNKENITRKFTFMKGNLINQDKIKWILSDHSIAIGPTFLFSKKSFEHVSGYRNMNVEDYDLVSRLLINKFRIGYLGYSLLLKRLRKNSISYNSLFYQYIIMKCISKYLKKYNYNRIISLKEIKNNINNLSTKDKVKYNKYANYRYNFNDRKNLINLFNMIKSIICSEVVFNHLIWSLKNKFVDKLFNILNSIGELK